MIYIISGNNLGLNDIYFDTNTNLLWYPKNIKEVWDRRYELYPNHVFYKCKDLTEIKKYNI